MRGDVAVWHLDGYAELRDRSKDVIISGGENISSIEIEQVIYRHPAVLECAVIGVPREKWGESPKAFVTLERFNLYRVHFLLLRVCLSALQSARPIVGATAKRSLGVPWFYLSYDHTPKRVWRWHPRPRQSGHSFN